VSRLAAAVVELAASVYEQQHNPCVYIECMMGHGLALDAIMSHLPDWRAGVNTWLTRPSHGKGRINK
jgi:hypothetical protein